MTPTLFKIMLIVNINVNEKNVHHLTATNLGAIIGKADTEKQEWRRYRLKCGCLLEHNRKNGALCLFIQMVGHEMGCDKPKT